MCDVQIVFPCTLRWGWYVGVSQLCLHLMASWIMSQWESPCPCRPGLEEPPCNKSLLQNESQVQPCSVSFHVECRLSLENLQLWTSRAKQQCGTIYLVLTVQQRGSCNIWLLKKILICSMYYLCCVWFPSNRLTVFKPILSQMCYGNILK